MTTWCAIYLILKYCIKVFSFKEIRLCTFEGKMLIICIFTWILLSISYHIKYVVDSQCNYHITIKLTWYIGMYLIHYHHSFRRTWRIRESSVLSHCRHENWLRPRKPRVTEGCSINTFITLLFYGDQKYFHQKYNKRLTHEKLLKLSFLYFPGRENLRGIIIPLRLSKPDLK